jgi:hypothetical protein
MALPRRLIARMSRRPFRTRAGVPAIEVRRRWMLGADRRLGTPTRRSGRFRGSGQVKQVEAFGFVELQGAGHGAENLIGDPRMFPFSRRVYHSVLTPASTATSSRRRPGTRRCPPPGARPACSGVSLTRLVARNSRISARLSTQPGYGHPPAAEGSYLSPYDRALPLPSEEAFHRSCRLDGQPAGGQSLKDDREQPWRKSFPRHRK